VKGGGAHFGLGFAALDGEGAVVHGGET